MEALFVEIGHREAAAQQAATVAIPQIIVAMDASPDHASLEVRPSTVPAARAMEIQFVELGRREAAAQPQAIVEIQRIIAGPAASQVHAVAQQTLLDLLEMSTSVPAYGLMQIRSSPACLLACSYSLH